ncbi:MAG TPA: VWA domain-containing protein [Vicinamibacteria bacterium]|nr:VWA domain-containing protein [Vicinamibacteria bacterium]
MKRIHFAPVVLVLASAAALVAQDAQKPAAAAKPAAPTAPGASQEAAPPTFPAQVEQVIVDVVVTDKKGNAIRGLKQGDITVIEDGAPQSVVSFEAVELPDQPSATPPPPPRVSVNTTPEERRGRTFAVVFDDMNITPWKANQAKAAVASFIEKGTREGDRVTLISTAGGTWWTARMESGRPKLLDMVKRFDGRHIPDTSQERMTDWEALRIHVYRDPQVTERVMRRFETYGVGSSLSRTQDSSGRAGTVEDPYITGRASEVYYQAVTRLRTTLDALERALNGLAAAKGRKSVILVSEGFIHDLNVDEFKRVNEASRRANAAIYFLNARGLEGMPIEMTAQFGPALPDQDIGYAMTEGWDAVGGSEVVSSESGGFTVRNTNDLSAGIQKIANETQAYYLLGYIPSNTTRDGRFRKIQVKLANGKGLQVRARKGYYAPSDTGKSAMAPKKGVDPVIQRALDSPWAEDAIPLRMTHFIGDERTLGKAAVLVATEVDIRALEFEEKDGRSLADLQFLLVVAHRESGEFFRYDQGVSMKLQPGTRERYSRFWYPIVRDFELKSGDYQAKIVVRDPRTGRVGTVIHEFDVPRLDELRVSTPVLSDTRAPSPATEGVPGGILAVLARREFGSGSDLLCQFEVYGAKKDEKTGMPRVTQGYVVTRPDGTVLTGSQPSVINPTSLGQVMRTFGFRLTDAPLGDYEIVMVIRDDIAGRSFEMREPFKVVEPLPASAMPPPFAAQPSAATPSAATPPVATPPVATPPVPETKPPGR